MKLRRKIKVGLLLLFFIGLLYSIVKYQDFMTPPSSRLQSGNYYDNMPPDTSHIYLQLPLDHKDPNKGNYTGFYILSPNFKKGKPVIFQLYDNQQEKVSPFSGSKGFEEFDEVVGKNNQYVVIGNRGVPPTIFPELFDTKGNTDISKALQLYGSEQQVEDIEAVRLDMQQKGLLPSDGKIMVLGGSGGGFLVQQYLNKYGEHVSRALIESSSAPDLCLQLNLPFAKNFNESNAIGARLYDQLYKNKEIELGLNWILFKVGLEGDTALQNSILRKESNWINIKKHLKRLSIPNNSFVIKKIFHSPSTLEVRVRIWELIGADLIKYHPTNENDYNLMYASMIEFLPDFMEAYENKKISVPSFNINREKYAGEMMIWANTGDQDFGSSRANLLIKEYSNSKLIVFNGATHRIKKSQWHYDLLEAYFTNGFNTEDFKELLKMGDSVLGK